MKNNIYLVVFGCENDNRNPAIAAYEIKENAERHLQKLLNGYKKNEPWEDWKGKIVPLTADRPLKRQMFTNQFKTSLNNNPTAEYQFKVRVFLKPK